MNISVIIPVLDEASLVAGSVRRAWEAGADEIIVCDGGSTDQTVKIAQDLDCHLLRGPQGRASQQNQAAAASRGDVLLFLHVDSWLPAGAIGQIRRALRDRHCQGGAFRQHIESAGRIYRLLEWGNAARIRLLRLAFGDQGLFLRRELFDRLGRFPQVPLMEDLRLMRKFRRVARPALLPGPLHVDPRRWQKYGVARQTLRNWSLLTAEKLGVCPSQLKRFYPSH